METPRFAVVLSGCGVFDGSEIHEAVCALLAIDEAGCAYQCFAPNPWQAKTVDHFTGRHCRRRRQPQRSCGICPHRPRQYFGFVRI